MTEGSRDDRTKRVKIYFRGHIDADWMHWFEGLRVEQIDGESTVLSGEVRDQSALYGIIAKLRDLGLELISVESEGAASDRTR
jgi:hypothetical protein